MPNNTTPNCTWVEVRRRGKLLFRYDPIRDLVQIVRRGEMEIVDLSDYRAQTNCLHTIENQSQL